MSADILRDALQSATAIAAAGVRSGVEIGQRESAARIAQLEAEVAHWKRLYERAQAALNERAA